MIEITSMSTRGQIVIPNKIRKALNLKAGTKFIIIQDNDNMLLKPIESPKNEEFTKLIALGNKIRTKLNLKREDVNRAIRFIRKSS